jgi:hypothetical protein
MNETLAIGIILMPEADLDNQIEFLEEKINIFANKV